MLKKYLHKRVEGVFTLREREATLRSWKVAILSNCGGGSRCETM
jgi:hypothetical protein